MAEPDRPERETSRPAAERESGLLVPPTEEELTASGEPSLEEVRAAAAGDARTAEPDAARPAETPADGTTASRTEPTAAEPAVAPAAAPVPAPTRAEPTASEPTPASQPAPPPAPAAQTPIAPAEEPLPPRQHGNRVVGTAWVLLAAGVFELLFFAINALVAFTFGGAPAAWPQVLSVAQTSLAWLPVLLFFLLFELTVLLFNRAGRFAYVFASLIVGLIVYVATALLFSLIVQHTLGDANTLAQTFLNWEFLVIGLIAREVMLWTGLAIGSRGIRVRRRNKAARARYEQELADARA